MSDLTDKFAAAINSVSAENGSNTPDFILAEYLVRCLKAFDLASWAPTEAEKAYGLTLEPLAQEVLARAAANDECTCGPYADVDCPKHGSPFPSKPSVEVGPWVQQYDEKGEPKVSATYECEQGHHTEVKATDLPETIECQECGFSAVLIGEQGVAAKDEGESAQSMRFENQAANLKAAWHCSQCRKNGEKEIADLLTVAADRAHREALEWAAQQFAPETNNGITVYGVKDLQAKLRTLAEGVGKGKE